MLREPEAVQVPPPVPAQVQVQVSEAGKVSATVAFVGWRGPELCVRVVWVAVWPGVVVVTPSVLVTDRSALAPRASVSVAELLPGVGSVTPADRKSVVEGKSVDLGGGRIIKKKV